MTDNGSPVPQPSEPLEPSSPLEPFSGDLSVPDLPLLQEHFRELTQWVLGDAVGDRLGPGDRDALAEEIAVVLASSLAPVLRREIELQAEKLVAGMQQGPLSFGYDHQVRVDGFTVADVVKVFDAVGRLMEAGVGEALWGLHETHRRMLFTVRDSWLAKNGLLPDGEDS